ncbi:hypothetical protein JMJ35_010384 [Cladonia borealis]|uniref:DUF6594 domain-containing protein n=1 Tax=Cladonia borealis TaxID=184061 RepID=A0AA39QRY6_9LECA|nr:hypothetical protein JMJ35_010384 [Cladonia borealis]
MVDPNRLPDQWMVEDFRQGYPRFCALIDTHPALNIFRRFSKLRARIILRKQDTLSALEQQLETLDRQETTALYLASNRLDGNTERQTVLDDIEKAVKDYDDLIQRHSRILNTQNADSGDVCSLQNWIAGNRCLARADCAYLSRKDLFSMVEQDSALIKVQSVVEGFMIRYFASIYRRCCVDLSQDPNVYLPSEAWIGRLSRILIAGVVIILLLVPILICSNITSTEARIITVSFATITCVTTLVFAVQVRTIEMIVAGTTYATVLTVFVSGTGSST